MKRSEQDALRLAPYIFILFSSVPLNSVAPLHLLQLPDGAAFQYVLSRISIGDFFLCGALLYHLPPRDSSKNTHGPPAVFWVYAFMLGFVGFQFGHLFIEERNRYDLFEFFRILAVFLVLVLAYRAQLASLSDREFLFLTTLFALCTVLLPNAFGIDVFQYLNNYSGNAEVLAERLKGLSRNTNTFSLVIFCFLTLYLLNRSYEHAPTKVELIGILILVTLAIATKGRHALLTVIVATLSILEIYRYRVAQRVALVGCFLLVSTTIAFAIFPIQTTSPFINLAPSSYRISHDTYLSISSEEPTAVTRANREIVDLYRQYVSPDLVDEVTSGKSLSAELAEMYRKGFLYFAQPHNLILEFFIKHGYVFALVFLLTNGYVAYSFWHLAGDNRLRLKIFIVSTFSYLYIDSSKVFWFCFFIFVFKAAAARREEKNKCIGA